MSGGQISMPDRVPRTRTARRCSSRRSTRRRSSRGYAHIPGLKVVTPATPADAKGLLKSAIRDDNPVVLHRGRDALQHQGRGARRASTSSRSARPTSSAPARRHPRSATRQDGARGAQGGRAAGRRTASTPRCVDLRTLRPLDDEAILASVSKTNRAVVVEEGWAFAGVGAQVVDVIQRECFDELDAPGAARAPAPTSRCPTTSTSSGPPSPTPPRRSRRSQARVPRRASYRRT